MQSNKIRNNIFIRVFLIILILIVINKKYFIDNNLDRYRKTVQTQKYMMHALGGTNGKYSYINSVEVLSELYTLGTVKY